MALKVIVEKGQIGQIRTKKFDINFRRDYSPGFYLDDEDILLAQNKNGFSGEKRGIEFCLTYTEKEREVILHSHIKNNSGHDISVKNLGLRTGIDCCMEQYPAWNHIFFPTLIRCEKTHLWGYFESPEQKLFAIAVTEPVASYHLEYNKLAGGDFGHRIYTVGLDFLKHGILPERHPQERDRLLANEELEFNLHIIPAECIAEIPRVLYTICRLPMVKAEKYTLEPGEVPAIDIFAGDKYALVWKTPDHGTMNYIGPMEAYGNYTLEISDQNNKTVQAMFYCRKDWGEYLKAARREVLRKPPKASTHCESWYGFFSGFLAAKHYPDRREDQVVSSYLEETLPLIWDREKMRPKTAPSRIQNWSALISVLVDKYECNPSQNKDDLLCASEIGDFLITTQTDDGAYRNHGVHYTCVIYVAKSMLELCEAEKMSGDAVLMRKAEAHYASAKRAVEELTVNLECIGTEGEHTLEDGMIACSALQIGAFALTLDEKKRNKYREAAEHMIGVHECLEQMLIPDCRMNGASLRFWEAQYDVMIRANFMNSPHGWSAWTIYAKFYLYLLTAKSKYLVEMLNALGACVQLMDLDGNLRWAFAADPQICAGTMTADCSRPVPDGYKSVVIQSPAYRGKYIEKVFGEEYIEMVSGWFRTGEQRVTGGYEHCPLIDENNHCLTVDNQGGACDNDVHEIFKCMEETVLKKAFIHECEDGHFISASCRIKDGYITVNEEIRWICFCLKKEKQLVVSNRSRRLGDTGGRVILLHLDEGEK